MAAATLNAKPVVKLSDSGMVAGTSRGRLHIQYQSTLLAVHDLDDAIKVAQMVLDYARSYGIDIATAAADKDAAGEQWFEQEKDYALRF